VIIGGEPVVEHDSEVVLLLSRQADLAETAGQSYVVVEAYRI